MSLKVLSTGLSQMKTYFQGDQCLKNSHFVPEFVIVIIDLKTRVPHFKTESALTSGCAVLGERRLSSWRMADRADTGHSAWGRETPY